MTLKKHFKFFIGGIIPASDGAGFLVISAIYTVFIEIVGKMLPDDGSSSSIHASIMGLKILRLVFLILG